MPDPREIIRERLEPMGPRDTRDAVSAGRVQERLPKRNAPPIDLQPETPMVNSYFLPGEALNGEVLQRDIHQYLGNDATVRPYRHPDVSINMAVPELD